MTVTLEIPEEPAQRLRPEAAQMSQEALGLEAHRQGSWTEAELGRFLGLTRGALDQFLKDHGVDLAYSRADLERQREVHRKLAGLWCWLLPAVARSTIWSGLIRLRS